MFLSVKVLHVYHHEMARAYNVVYDDVSTNVMHECMMTGKFDRVLR